MLLLQYATFPPFLYLADSLTDLLHVVHYPLEVDLSSWREIIDLSQKRSSIPGVVVRRIGC